MGVAVQIADDDDRRDAVLIEALAEVLIAPELTESRRVLMRERVLAAAGDSAPPLTDGAQRPKQIGCLSRQRDQVRFASFHAFARNAPLGGVEVELAPLGLPKFTGTNEHVGSQPECVRRARLAYIPVDRPEQHSRQPWHLDG